MSDTETPMQKARRKSRLRWITLGEAVAVAAVIISGLGLYNSYVDRRDARADKAAEAARTASPAPFYLRGNPSADGSTLTLSPVVADHVIQGQTLRFPPSFKLSAVTTSSDARIEAGWFGDALKKDRRDRQLPDETQGDERVPVLIETDYLAGGTPLRGRAIYDVGYALEGHFLRGASVKLRGLSLVTKAPADNAAADRRLAALWDVRAGKVKAK
jgi:hypothetical protein